MPPQKEKRSDGNAAAPAGKMNGRGIHGERIEAMNGGDGTGVSGTKEKDMILKGEESDLGAPSPRRVNTLRDYRRAVIEVEVIARIRAARGRERVRGGEVQSRLGENHLYLDAVWVWSARFVACRGASPSEAV